MKKIITFFIILSLLLIPSIRYEAEEIDDSTLTKFNYYPLGTLSSKRELKLKWTSSKEMDNLSIKYYSTKENAYVEIFNMNWDLTIDENPYNACFKIVSYPVDDVLTPDIDESLVGDWNYEISFLFNEDALEIIKLVFAYDADDKNYVNNFILPNVVYPIILPTETPSGDDENSSKTNFSTKNALIAAVFATICSVIGTVLIIISSNHKTIVDEEEILS